MAYCRPYWLRYSRTPVVDIVMYYIFRNVKYFRVLGMFFFNFAISIFPKNVDRFQIMSLLTFVIHFPYFPFLNTYLCESLNGLFKCQGVIKITPFLSKTHQKFARIEIRPRISVLKFSFETHFRIEFLGTFTGPRNPLEKTAVLAEIFSFYLRNMYLPNLIFQMIVLSCRL